MTISTRIIGLAALGSLAVGLTACSDGGMGSVPMGLVELYDMAAPDGVIELELDRNGKIIEMEADIPVASLPAAVKKAAMEKAPGAVITGGEREMQAAGKSWEVKLRWEDRDWEFVIDDNGVIKETEKELQQAEAPAAVLAGANKRVPGAEFKSVEIIERGDVTEYHVKQTKDGASYKIILSADGTVKRAVREARAEIEIPLK